MDPQTESPLRWKDRSCLAAILTAVKWRKNRPDIQINIQIISKLFDIITATTHRVRCSLPCPPPSRVLGHTMTHGTYPHPVSLHRARIHGDGRHKNISTLPYPESVLSLSLHFIQVVWRKVSRTVITELFVKHLGKWFISALCTWITICLCQLHGLLQWSDWNICIRLKRR